MCRKDIEEHAEKKPKMIMNYKVSKEIYIYLYIKEIHRFSLGF